MLIDPETSRVDVTWRAVIAADAQLANAQLRIARTDAERQRLAAMLGWQRQTQKSMPDGDITAEEEATHGA